MIGQSKKQREHAYYSRHRTSYCRLQKVKAQMESRHVCPCVAWPPDICRHRGRWRGGPWFRCRRRAPLPVPGGVEGGVSGDGVRCRVGPTPGATVAHAWTSLASPPLPAASSSSSCLLCSAHCAVAPQISSAPWPWSIFLPRTRSPVGAAVTCYVHTHTHTPSVVATENERKPPYDHLYSGSIFFSHELELEVHY